MMRRRPSLVAAFAVTASAVVLQIKVASADRAQPGCYAYDRIDEVTATGSMITITGVLAGQQESSTLTFASPAAHHDEDPPRIMTMTRPGAYVLAMLVPPHSWSRAAGRVAVHA